MTAAARGLAGALYRSVRAHAPRSVGALCIAVALQLTLLGTALASFAGTKTAGPQALKSAKLADPTGLATANGGCAGGSGQTNVSATWTASAELDANGNALINGYTLLRSTTSGGSLLRRWHDRHCHELHRRQSFRSGNPAGLPRQRWL